MLDTLIRNWWLIALRGIAAVGFGVLAIAWPDITVGVLVALFGAFLFVDGAFTIGAAIAEPSTDRSFYILRGVFCIAVGIITFAWPDLTQRTLLYIIAIWAIIFGVAEIVLALQLRKVVVGEWLAVVGGVLAVALGVLLIAFPGDGAIALVRTIGIFAILDGAALIGFGLTLLALKDRLPEVRHGRPDMV
jgi:uncharacterized membrane protein HdeD (DUF308 family)